MTIQEFLKSDPISVENLVILHFGKRSDEYILTRAILNDTWSKANKLAKKRIDAAMDNIIDFFEESSLGDLKNRYFIFRAVYKFYKDNGKDCIVLIKDILKEALVVVEEKNYRTFDEVMEYCAKQGWTQYETIGNKIKLTYVANPDINWPK